MTFLICQKHNKYQKIASRILNNAYLCMHTQCSNKLKIFCSSCKNQHRDHTVKILTIEDLSYLIEQLLKKPKKQSQKNINDTLNIMKKLKLLKQLRKKIDQIEKDIETEAIHLIQITEQISQQYENIKQSINQLGELMATIQKKQSYSVFQKNSKQLLQHLQFDSKKEKFNFTNRQIQNLENQRKALFESAKIKIDEVKDYSMKIIEVIIYSNENDSDIEQDAVIKMKGYDLLKKNLYKQNQYRQFDFQGVEDLKNSKSTTCKSRNGMVSRLTDSLETNLLDSLQINFQEVKPFDQQMEKNNSMSSILHSKNQKEALQIQIVKWRQKCNQNELKIIRLQYKLKQISSFKPQAQKYKEQLLHKNMSLSYCNVTNTKNRRN